MTDMRRSDILTPGTSFIDAVRLLIYERWEAVWDAVPAAIEGSDPEAVHDVRVASRRLRAAMDVAFDLFPASWYKSLHKTAKEITRELGEVRDLEVQLQYLSVAREESAPGDRPGIDRLIDRLTSRSDAARARMLEYLAELERRGIRDEVERRFGSLLPDGMNGAPR